jgi:lipopolysaccharide export system protein LptC
MNRALYWAKTLWYRITMYLPVVIIALLALGTWWLARNTPALAPPTAEAPAKHEPDYYMHNFSVKNFDATGVLSSEVAGNEARHFPDTDVLEIDGARIRSFKLGRTTTASAQRAYSKGDGSEVQLVGNAVVVRDAGPDAQGRSMPRMEFRSEFLHAFLSTEQIKSNKSVSIRRDQDVFTADSLQYDNLDRVALLQGRVKGTLVPRSRP